MAKKKDDSVGDHVKFKKGTYAPYITPYDLVTSESFERELKRARERSGLTPGFTKRKDPD